MKLYLTVNTKPSYSLGELIKQTGTFWLVSILFILFHPNLTLLNFCTAFVLSDIIIKITEMPFYGIRGYSF